MFLKKYINTQDFSPNIIGGEIKSISIEKIEQILNMVVFFPELVTKKAIFTLEKAIQNCKLNLTKVNIFPKYLPNLFSENYYNELLLEVINQIPSISGCLEGSHIKIQENTLEIFLSHGGKEILINKK